MLKLLTKDKQPSPTLDLDYIPGQKFLEINWKIFWIVEVLFPWIIPAFCYFFNACDGEKQKFSLLSWSYIEPQSHVFNKTFMIGVPPFIGIFLHLSLCTDLPSNICHQKPPFHFHSPTIVSKEMSLLTL